MSEHRDRLLVVDDDPSFGALVERVANERGFQTAFVSSLLDIGSFARIRDYDVVLIDYFLDNLRGDEIAQYVDMFFSEVPVVIMSAKSFTDEDRAAWPNSVRKFVPKTAGAKKIIEEAHQVLHRERWLKRLRDQPHSSQTI